MSHPYKGECKGGTATAKMRYADGGKIDAGIDISDGSGGGYSLPHVMQTERSIMDADEVKSGSRFSDNGSRMPGQQKAKNDAYTDKLKQRNR